MKILFSIILILSITAIFSTEVTFQNNENVYQLTAENFELFIKQNKFVLAKFYASWCGHCKALVPHYIAAAKKLQEYSNVKLVEVDIMDKQNSDLQRKVFPDPSRPMSFPTIKFFVDGDFNTVIAFDGKRTEEGIYDWVKTKVESLSVAGSQEQGKNAEL